MIKLFYTINLEVIKKIASNYIISFIEALGNDISIFKTSGILSGLLYSKLFLKNLLIRVKNLNTPIVNP